MNSVEEASPSCSRSSTILGNESVVLHHEKYMLVDTTFDYEETTLAPDDHRRVPSQAVTNHNYVLEPLWNSRWNRGALKKIEKGPTIKIESGKYRTFGTWGHSPGQLSSLVAVAKRNRWIWRQRKLNTANGSTVKHIVAPPNRGTPRHSPWDLSGLTIFVENSLRNYRQTVLRGISDEEIFFAIKKAQSLSSDNNVLKKPPTITFNTYVIYGRRTTDSAFSNVTNVALSKCKRKVLVPSTKENVVNLYDLHGTLKKSFGKNIFKKPLMVAVCPVSENTIIIDVDVQRHDGLYHIFIKKEKEILKKINLDVVFRENIPTACCINQVGNIVLMFQDSRTIIEFNKENKILKQFTHDKFIKPIDLITNISNEFFVADQLAHTIWVFNYKGQYTHSLGGPELLNLPFSIAFDRWDRLVVASNSPVFNIKIISNHKIIRKHKNPQLKFNFHKMIVNKHFHAILINEYEEVFNFDMNIKVENENTYRKPLSVCYA